MAEPFVLGVNAIAAARAVKHVLVKKPMASSLADAYVMIENCQPVSVSRQRVEVMVAYRSAPVKLAINRTQPVGVAPEGWKE